jgi:hypothetical protein
MTKSNTLLSVAIAAIIILLLSLNYIKCNTPTTQPQPSSDSLRMAIKILERQIGISEAERQQAMQRAVKAENDLKNRKPIYIERVRVIKESAPDTCQPYLTAIQAECDTMLAKADTTISELKNVIVNDSIVIAGYVQLDSAKTVRIVNLETDNATKDKQVKKLKLGTKIIAGVAALIMAISWGVSLGS